MGGTKAGGDEGGGDEAEAGEGQRDALTGRVLDAAGLKALAHPLRFQLLELLIEHGPGTASSLGELVGESSGTTSYHLRQLAKQGLIEEAHDLGTGRDRYWRALEEGWSLQGFEMLRHHETREDARFVIDESLRARIDRYRHWIEDGPRWGPEWTQASMASTARLRLTRDQLEALTTDLLQLVERYREQEADPDDPEAAQVVVDTDAFPIGDPPAQG